MIRRLLSLLVLVSFTFINQGLSQNVEKSNHIVIVGGSSTVYPISQAINQVYARQKNNSLVKVTTTGTSAGFIKFLNREITINNASRKIQPAEAREAQLKNINTLEIPIAYDGICIVVHKDNGFVSEISFNELQMIWSEHSNVRVWSDIRPEWPNTRINLYGPSSKHGTYDFFGEKIVSPNSSIREDYIPEDDYTKLMDDVSADRNGMAFVSYAYYVKNVQRVKALPINDGNETIAPNYSNILNKKYMLSRELYLYMDKNSLKTQEVEDFVVFYLNTAYAIVKMIGYVPLTREMYRNEREQVEAIANEYRKVSLGNRSR